MKDPRKDRRADRHIHRPTADRIYCCSTCGELAFYRGRSHTLRSLRGSEIERDGEALGLLADVVISAGRIVRLVVRRDGREHLEPYDSSVRIGDGSRTAA